MTATILSFPSLFERDQMEFDRKGTSNYTRASAEATMLGELAKVPRDRVQIAGRINSLKDAVKHLESYRPECIDDLVALRDGSHVALRLMPDYLHSLLGPMSA